MHNLITALGSNAATYEAIALKIVDLIDASEVSSEVGVIALKTAQLILDARERDAWEAINFTTTLSEFETSQEMSHVSQA
jgi:hypothetical protein